MNPTMLLAIAIAACLALTPQATQHADINYNLDPEGPRTPYLDSPIDAAANTLDVYEPAKPGKQRPIVLYVHGGGWMVGNKSETHLKDELFTRSGYVFVSVNYRLSPFPIDRSYPANRVRSPHHVQDLAEAIAWLQIHAKEYGADPKNITLIGHSAGAQLVALLATDTTYLRERKVSPEVIKGVVALDSAAYDIGLSIQSEPLTAMRYQAFGTVAENQASGIWQATSATAHAKKNAPAFLMVTQSDEPSRILQNEQLATALGLDPSVAVLVVPKSHSEINKHLGSTADTSTMTSRVVDFIKRSSR